MTATIRTFPVLPHETQRMQALQRYQVLDTPADQAFDDLTKLAAGICHTPIAVVSLVDHNRLWFKSRVGVGLTEISRDHAFCAYAICEPSQLLVVSNAAQDHRFATSALVASEAHVRFYAGAPLVTPEGHAIGTLSVIDCVPRELNHEQLDALRMLSRQVVSQLELRLQLRRIKQTQSQLIQSEKMSALGQLVAGVAHEINNPVGFIYSNLEHLQSYSSRCLQVIQAYGQQYPQPPQSLQTLIEQLDLAFIAEDLPKLLNSTQSGTERIQNIVTSLRNFSRLDEAGVKPVNIHEGIESTLVILQNRLEGDTHLPAIEVICDYGDLPALICHAGNLNQVFLNLLSNAIDAIREHEVNHPTIHIRTKAQEEWAMIQIQDNGIGIPEKFLSQIFDPFFTTKPIGHGTGLGLSTSYQIITEQHQGNLTCKSQPGYGSAFTISLPLQNLQLLHCN